MIKPRFLLVAITLVFMFFSAALAAHPEDEFCNGEGLDPLLCAQLAELDSSAGGAAVPGELLRDKNVALDRSMWATLALYTGLGFEHILPAGVDHLLFVLALLLVSPTLRVLLVQISCFTLAHSITLISASAGLMNFSSAWIEFLIAVSIVVVAMENLVVNPESKHRLGLVFGFGLLHGLGFAGALSEVGLPQEHFLTALLGFNIGVELGQVVFAACVFLVLMPLARKPEYRRSVLVVGSLAVAAVAVFWSYQRLVLVLAT